MSMIMILESVSADAPIERTESTIPFPVLSEWGSGMLIGGLEDGANSISLEKAWHGLHFLLTGDPWAVLDIAPFSCVAVRNRAKTWAMVPRVFLIPMKYEESTRPLSSITSDDLWSRFDAERMAEADIYGAGWDDEPETELREEFIDYFESSKSSSQTAEDGNSLRIIIT